jgi:hypothetical protein
MTNQLDFSAAPRQSIFQPTFASIAGNEIYDQNNKIQMYEK